MDVVEPVFDRSTFSKNRQRLLQHEVAQQFFDGMVRQADRRGLLSNEHFTVDSTLIEAAASLKSFKLKDQPPSDKPPDDPGNPTVNFHGQRRSNATHQSTTDPEARLAKKGKGKEAHLAYAGHALMEHPNGLLVDFQVNQATGTAEREIVPDLIDQARERGFRPRTLAGDKGYDTRQSVANLRARNVDAARDSEHQRAPQRDRSTHHTACWLWRQPKETQVSGGDLRLDENRWWLRRTRFIGLALTQLAAYLVATAYNLVTWRDSLHNPWQHESAGDREPRTPATARPHRASVVHTLALKQRSSPPC